jgi:hypothetical protein
MISFPIKLKARTVLLSMAVFTLLVVSNGIAQGFSKYSLPYYAELKTYPLLIDKKYDAGTVTSITGNINKLFYVEYYAPNSNLRIIGLELKTDKGNTYQIHLAPLSWLEIKKVPIQKGNKLTVRGSIVSSGKEAIILAVNIYWEGNSVQLRYRDGRWRWNVPCESTLN